MASSIGGPGGMAPVRGLGGNGDDKKPEKKVTVRLSDGDHTISRKSSESKSQSTSNKVGDLTKKFEEAKGSSVKSKSGFPNKWELKNIPLGIVKDKVGKIDERVAGIKVKVAQKPGSPGTVKPEVAPKPGSLGTVKPEVAPKPGSLGTVKPEPAPRKGSSGTVKPEPAPRKGSSGTVKPEPAPRKGSSGTVKPEPAPRKGSSGTVKQKTGGSDVPEGAVGGAESPGESSAVDVVSGPVVDSGQGELSLLGHIVQDGREVQRMMKEAQPLSESASSSVKEKAKKAWAAIKAKLAAILASLRNLLGTIKERSKKGGIYEEETADIERAIAQLNDEFMANMDLTGYVSMVTGEPLREIPEGLEDRAEKLKANIQAYNKLINRRHN